MALNAPPSARDWGKRSSDDSAAIALVTAGATSARAWIRAAAHSASPASQAGLIVEQGRDDDTRLDPARPIRCFVEGQFAGEITLTECARRNGVATGALDVGVDETGALAASGSAGTMLTPLPPPKEQIVEAEATLPPVQQPAPSPSGQGRAL
jgi:hypothetical protein